MRQCRHKDGGDRVVRWWPQHPINVPSFEVNVCSICDAWLPLGPSNDDDERVSVEIDAAHVAATWNEPDRAAYWLTIEALSDPNGRNVEVIGLARDIVEHKDEQ